MLFFFFTVYSVPGFGFASGGLMIIAEIILTKLMRRNSQRFAAPFGTILLLLILFSTLAAVTIFIIDTYNNPDLNAERQ